MTPEHKYCVHDLAPEMFAILDAIARREHLMEWEIPQELASRIRRVLKEVHGV